MNQQIYFLFAIFSILIVDSFGVSLNELKKNSQLKMEARDADYLTELPITTAEMEADLITEQVLVTEIKPSIPQKIDHILLEDPTPEQPVVNENNNLTTEKSPKVEVNIVEKVSAPRRKLVTYDQRQEGKFNIRADLENFMIVFVPSKASSQLSLLELLMKSAARTQGKNSNKKYPKKQEQQKTQDPQHTFEYPQYKQNSPLYHRVPSTFIESRSPYKVDIDSSLGHDSSPYMEVKSPSSTYQEYQPQYPQSPVLQLLKSMPHLVQQPYHHLGKDLVKTANHRNYRSIDDSLYGFSGIDGEGVENTYLEDDDLTNSDVNAFNSLNIENIETINHTGSEGGYKLLGAVEQCGPDRLRDSYGICQFISLK